jgi:sodium-dependent phosphate transporter
MAYRVDDRYGADTNASNCRLLCEICGQVHRNFRSAAGVSDTIRKDVTDIKAAECWACGYCNSKVSLFMFGMAAALLATGVFLILSSTTAMPVSTTHAIVGGVLGMTLVAVAPKCVQWTSIAKIASSWVLSPLLSGAIGSALYVLLLRLILYSPGV